MSKGGVGVLGGGWTYLGLRRTSYLVPRTAATINVDGGASVGFDSLRTSCLLLRTSYFVPRTAATIDEGGGASVGLAHRSGFQLVGVA